MKQNLPPLWLCIFLDFIGYLSFSVPILGDLSDIVWAPIAGWLFYRMFKGQLGVFGGIFSFLEELLPLTDVIPTFSIAWFLLYIKQPKADTLLK
jgi:hypothetical protein